MKKTSMMMICLFSILLMVSCNNANSNKAADGEKSVNKTAKAEAKLPVKWSKNANIYEVNLRQYSEEGTLKAFAQQLPRLKEMGVDILWFMPIHPISEKNKKGSLGSYYAISNYKEVNPEFGTLEDFKAVVDQAHELGMYVLLDWVANHTGWDHHWTETNPEFYEKNEKGELISPYDWSDVISLDYNNMDMRAEMLSALKYWLTEADIDGYRCDVASEVPTDFWENVRSELDQIKPVFMLAESEESDLLEMAFDMNYGWEFHHIMNGVAKGEKNVQDMMTYFEKEKKNTPERAYKMYFLTNHDENSWNGTIEERLGDAEKAMAVLNFTMHDMPLIYSGQEAGNTKRLEFFEKDVIDWKDFPMQDFYKKLISYKHDYPAFWNGQNGGEFIHMPTDHDDQVIAFKRIKGDSDMMVIVNLSPDTYEATFIKDDLVGYKPLLMKNFRPTMEINSFTMSPWGYIVMERVQ